MTGCSRRRDEACDRGQGHADQNDRRSGEINAVSFVSPKAVPQMADSSEAAALMTRKPGVVYDATVPNLKGAERARAAGMDAIVVFVSASDQGSRAKSRQVDGRGAEGRCGGDPLRAAERHKGLCHCVQGIRFRLRGRDVGGKRHRDRGSTSGKRCRGTGAWRYIRRGHPSASGPHGRICSGASRRFPCRCTCTTRAVWRSPTPWPP